MTTKISLKNHFPGRAQNMELFLKIHLPGSAQNMELFWKTIYRVEHKTGKLCLKINLLGRAQNTANYVLKAIYRVEHKTRQTMFEKPFTWQTTKHGAIFENPFTG